MQILILTPEEALQRRQAGARLLDIRGADEQAAGMAEGAEAVPMDTLLADPRGWLDEKHLTVLICQRGLRSQAATDALVARGHAGVASVAGGTERWISDGLPMQPADEPEEFLDRYSRQIRLPQVGLEGQRRLRSASVLLVGAGGLGAPAALYLAAAGVGRLRIADHDVVERSNLQRQVLHSDAGIGGLKVESALARLQDLNPSITVDARAVRVDAGNVDALLEGIDVVLDGADNFPVREVINAACIRHRVPLVYGAVQRFEGQASVFDAGRHPGAAPCYRCLFPDAPGDGPNCAEAGVLGVVPGIIGMVQATEVLKLLLGIGEPLVGRLLRFDALRMRFDSVRVPVDPACPACGMH